jgi:hypothetical protein
MTVWQGKHFWIWNMSSCFGGDVNKIISKMKALGVRGVIVKAHDGANVWPQFRSTVKAFKNAGLIVGAWGYHYGKDVEGEAKATLDSISAGADWYVIDAEIEYEGKQLQALQLGRLLRAVHPNYTIGYSAFPFADVHHAYPYKEFSSFCNVALPQVYWGDLKPKVSECLQKTFSLYAQWKIPVAPVGQTYVSTSYTPSAVDYQNFEKVSKQYKATGVSFWDIQHASEAMFSAVKAMNFPVTAPVTPAPTPKPPVVNLDEPSDWAKASVEKAIIAGVLTKDTYGRVYPKSGVTREQFAVILDRLGILDDQIKKG